MSEARCWREGQGWHTGVAMQHAGGHGGRDRAASRPSCRAVLKVKVVKTLVIITGICLMYVKSGVSSDGGGQV